MTHDIILLCAFILCSTLSTLRECLSIAITKSHHTPFLHLVTRGTRCLTRSALNRNSALTTLSGNISSWCFCSHKLLRSPRKPARKISKIPFKVLDAPELQDDFYLNLVDWSAGNLLSVGLGACVYLWSACTSQVCVCDLLGAMRQRGLQQKASQCFSM